MSDEDFDWSEEEGRLREEPEEVPMIWKRGRPDSPRPSSISPRKFQLLRLRRGLFRS